MSYMQFQQQCQDCKESWNAAFGIVNMTQIASPPTECPHCHGKNLIKIADGWKFNSVAPIPTESKRDPEGYGR
jgi:Zn finger protein HypA/HybF involved in hydrogenase expression